MAHQFNRRSVIIGGGASAALAMLGLACSSEGDGSDAPPETTSRANGSIAPATTAAAAASTTAVVDAPRITVDDDVLYWSAVRQLEALDRGQFTSVELTQAYLDRIDRIDPTLNAYVQIDAEGALAAAEAADARRAAGEQGGLLGLCTGIKDLIDVEGLVTTFGSKIFDGNVAAEDAPAVARLRAAGVVVLGKVNTTEFALSSPSTLHGASINPWDASRTAGGSSNGSGTAASAGLCSFAIGTDTAGSIRTPAAFQGVYGLKPTHGRVSVAGVGVLSSSMDTLGPMARDVADIAAVLQVIAGYEPSDPASLDQPVPDYLSSSDAAGALVVGAPAVWPDDVLAAEVEGAWRAAIDQLGAAGAEVRDIELPSADAVFPTWLTLTAGDANAWHEATLTARPDDYSEGSRLFLQGVAGTTAIDVSRAMIARHQLLVDNLAAMEGVDVMIMPVSAVTAPPIPEVTANAVLSDGRPISGDNVGPRFMMPYNVTGQPAITVPVAIASDGLPLAVQIVGRPFGEVAVLRAATLLAQRTDVDLRPPDFR